jgi:hypothetical protein
VTVEIETPDKASAKSHLDVRGSQASTLRALLRSEDQSRQVYDMLAAAFFPGARVITASAPDHEALVHPVGIDEELELGGSIRREGDHFRLKVPNDADTALTRLTDRQTPLDLGPPRRTKTQIVFRLGKAVRVTEKPLPVSVVDPCFEAHRSVTGDATTVTLTDDYQQTCPQISVADYPRFRAAMDRARALFDAAVVFDVAAGKTPAAR